MDARTVESEQEPTEMHTLRRQVDEQPLESLSRVSECSFGAKYKRRGVTRSSRFPTDILGR